jgi:hypothetical protein
MTTTIALYIGLCGDSVVLATSSGNVYNVVSRASKLRLFGHTVLVEKPVNEQFKPVAPFGWSSTMTASLVTPMRPMAKVLVSIYTLNLAAKRGMSGVALPPLVG